MRVYFFALLSLFLMSACGGSGSSSPSPAPAPAPSPSPTPSPAPSPSPISFACGFMGQPLSISNSGEQLIELEDYDTCDTSVSDADIGNSGGAYRDDDVDVMADASRSNGQIVVATADSEYLEFTVDVETSGLFDLQVMARAHDSLATELSLSVEGQSVLNSSVAVSAEVSAEWRRTSPTQIYLSDGPQVLRLQFDSGGAELDFLTLNYAEPLVISPADAVASMQIGINLGNTLDAYPNEGAWALPAQRSFFQAYKDANFKHVRIPATWDDHADTAAPYTVSSERMDRTEQIVDWALEQGYLVILNMHHEIWLKESYTNADRARFDAIWQQISERFANKSARLMLEILNEPHGLTIQQVDDINEGVLDIIREDGATRLVVFSGNGYTPVDSMLAAAIPNDDYLIGNFHSYDPWPFAGQCLRAWGSAQDKANLAEIYNRAKTWSTDNDIPVMVNEFGVAHYDFTAPSNICNEDDRLDYLAEHVANAIANGFGASVWDDGGSFVIYDRENGAWGPEMEVLVEFND
jgi:endoglucanase